MVNIAALAEPITILIYLPCQAQVTSLTSEKTEIITKYSDFSNLFSLDSAVELLKYTRINDHLIDLLDNKQTPYGPIYSLEVVELEMLKTYIKADLGNSFIRPSKSSVGTLILFVQKKNNSLYLCVDY